MASSAVAAVPLVVYSALHLVLAFSYKSREKQGLPTDTQRFANPGKDSGLPVDNVSRLDRPIQKNRSTVDSTSTHVPLGASHVDHHTHYVRSISLRVASASRTRG